MERLIPYLLVISFILVIFIVKSLLLSILIGIACFIFYKHHQSTLVKDRQKVIDSFDFPPTIKHKIKEKYPHLSESQLDYVIEGLREYFHLCNNSDKKMVSMPSQVVDIAWHEFILFTREYQNFCDEALGKFLHHTPAEAMESPKVAQRGIKIAWRMSCHRANINPIAAEKLPILFAMDAKLHIPDGFHYSLDCLSPDGENYCASHIKCYGGGGRSSSSDNTGCTGHSPDGGCGGD